MGWQTAADHTDRSQQFAAISAAKFSTSRYSNKLDVLAVPCCHARSVMLSRSTRSIRLAPPSAVAEASAAFVLGVLYWACGGTALLKSVGGVFQRAGEHGSVGLAILVWFTAGLKLLAAILGVVAVSGRPALTIPQQRQVRLLAWVAALILSVYGGVLSVTGWLVQTGVISAGAHADHEALRWHAYVWDPWFLVWGLLLAASLAGTRPRAHRRRVARAGPFLSGGARRR
jgi:hypothetical protein